MALLAHIWRCWCSGRRGAVFFQQKGARARGRGTGQGHPWGPVALTAVSFSSALNRSSQATADFWKASCRLMRFSTSSTVQPSSALRTSGSWLHSQASAIPASLPNTSTSKTAGMGGGGGSQEEGRSEWHRQSTVTMSRTGHRESYCPKAGAQGRAKDGSLEFHAQDSWSYSGNDRVQDPQPLLAGPGTLTKLEPVHLLLPLVCGLLAPCLQLRQLLRDLGGRDASEHPAGLFRVSGGLTQGN